MFRKALLLSACLALAVTYPAGRQGGAGQLSSEASGKLSGLAKTGVVCLNRLQKGGTEDALHDLIRNRVRCTLTSQRKFIADLESTTDIQFTDPELSTGLESTTDVEWTTDPELTTGLESTTDVQWTTDPELTTGLESTTDLQWSTDPEMTTGLESTTDVEWTTDPDLTTGLESTTDPSDLTTDQDFIEDTETTTDMYLENTQTFELPTHVELNTLSSEAEATEATEVVAANYSEELMIEEVPGEKREYGPSHEDMTGSSPSLRDLQVISGTAECLGSKEKEGFGALGSVGSYIYQGLLEAVS
ncbi:hypothetical protein CB1_001683063 [Camelus ferus]|nr:hypothetical protein CB1_001683063 [Camelus ferus]